MTTTLTAPAERAKAVGVIADHHAAFGDQLRFPRKALVQSNQHSSLPKYAFRDELRMQALRADDPDGGLESGWMLTTTE